MKTFNLVSRGQIYVSMSDLIYFLEQNGYHPRTEDLEAILRRCDHDADRCLSYEEFCELSELPGEEEGDEQESIVHDSKTNMNSPQRKEMSDQVQKA